MDTSSVSLWCVGRGRPRQLGSRSWRALAVTWSDFGRDLGGQNRYAAGDALSEQRTEERA